VLAAMMVLSAPAALAQSTTENPQQARVAPPDVTATGAPGDAAGGYDSRTLDAFARATRIVGALRNEYSPKIAVANIAGRPERAEALFDEMRARMHDAIDATGLTIETYEAIASRAEHDRALRARIEAIMTGARRSGAGGGSTPGRTGHAGLTAAGTAYDRRCAGGGEGRDRKPAPAARCGALARPRCAGARRGGGGRIAPVSRGCDRAPDRTACTAGTG
ncbi:MAG: DUF4168 domain-containing protein, partial [Proteobacteria bacterium]|nr:DUF4168 domain-containing protein [Pseudomonadota bacterium]